MSDVCLAYFGHGNLWFVQFGCDSGLRFTRSEGVYWFKLIIFAPYAILWKQILFTHSFIYQFR